MNIGDLVVKKWLSKWDKYSCQTSKNLWIEQNRAYIGIIIAINKSIWSKTAILTVKWLNCEDLSKITEDEIELLQETNNDI